MKNQRIRKNLTVITVLFFACSLLLPSYSKADSDKTMSFDSTGFVTCLDGYDEAITIDQLSKDGAIQTYPYYETNGDVRSLSNPRWKTIYEGGQLKRYIVTEPGKLQILAEGGPEEPHDSPYLIDFDKARTEFEALGEVSDVRIVFDFSIWANLIFGTVSGKEYVVPFFLHPEWYTFENGKAYPSEEIISLIEETIKSGKQASEKAGRPVLGGGGIAQESGLMPFFTNNKWVPIGATILILVIISAVLILLKDRIFLTKKRK